jgi:hypothetical protein
MGELAQPEADLRLVGSEGWLEIDTYLEAVATLGLSWRNKTSCISAPLFDCAACANPKFQLDAEKNATNFRTLGF